jgi:hypothetical protein
MLEKQQDVRDLTGMPGTFEGLLSLARLAVGHLSDSDTPDLVHAPQCPTAVPMCGFARSFGVEI